MTEGRTSTVDISVGDGGTTAYDASVVESPAELRASPAGRGATGPSATGVTWPVQAPGAALPAGWYRTATDYPDTGQDAGVRMIGCDGRTDMLFALDTVRSFVLHQTEFTATPRYPRSRRPARAACATCTRFTSSAAGSGRAACRTPSTTRSTGPGVSRMWCPMGETTPRAASGTARIYLAGGRRYAAPGTWSDLPAPTMFAGFAQQGLPVRHGWHVRLEHRVDGDHPATGHDHRRVGGRARSAGGPGPSLRRGDQCTIERTDGEPINQTPPGNNRDEPAVRRRNPEPRGALVTEVERQEHGSPARRSPSTRSNMSVVPEPQEDVLVTVKTRFRSGHLDRGRLPRVRHGSVCRSRCCSRTGARPLGYDATALWRA